MIREATVDDLKPLAELYKELMIYHNRIDPQSYKIPDDVACEEKIKGFIEDPQFNIFRVICHETDNIIDGFAVYILLNGHSSEEDPNGFISINDLFVAENARRKGIGTELINTMLKLAKEKCCNSVTIDVNIDNDSARKFYEKMGMKPKSIHMEKRI
ncbi:MAG: GNAT family N-acetyltransferase [Oscillospiraceae bacterium]|nr:GNAT family N-acetyltransferase [Oscillospiraceae bacterium]